MVPISAAVPGALPALLPTVARLGDGSSMGNNLAKTVGDLDVLLPE